MRGEDTPPTLSETVLSTFNFEPIDSVQAMRLNAGALLVAVLVIAIAATLGSQWIATESQRVELARLREEQRELARLRAEHERLAAAQVTVAEREKGRADRAALVALQAEVENARRRVDEVLQTAAEKRAAMERFPVGTVVAANEWRNAGGTTPAAALETVLWAAAGGDVGVFAQRLGFATGAEAAAKALWESLPPKLRAQVHSPAEAIAFLSIKDVPLGSAEVRRWQESDGPQQQVLVQLWQSGGWTKQSNLFFHRLGGEWKLMVTAPVVARYAALVAADGK